LVDSFDEQQLLHADQSDAKLNNVTVEGAGDGWVESFADISFNFLSVDIPPCPLFRDSHGGLVIPQIPLFQVLRKFDGNSWTDHVTKDEHVRKQYRIQTLPRYLILHLVRFTKNNFSLEKNSTIVTFPVKNLEMRDFLFHDEGDMSSFEKLSQQKDIDSCPSFDAVQCMEEGALRTLINRLGSELHLLQLHNSDVRNASKSSQETDLEELRLIAISVVHRIQLFASTKYDLLVNICHDSTQAAQSVTVGDLNMNLNSTSSGQQKRGSKSRNVSATAGNNINVLNSGAFKVQLHNKATDQWFEIQDLHVAETMPQLVGWWILTLLMFHCVFIFIVQVFRNQIF
jgi:U4/U6.U5 tri-snRNP-associated protein 2